MKHTLLLGIISLWTFAASAQTYVDLGLPSGTKWKTVNETNPKDKYNFFTYKEALVKFGDQLPTYEQLVELQDNCTWTWDTIKKGCTGVGPNGESIFLPAAGVRENGTVYLLDNYAEYWSRTPWETDNNYFWGLRFWLQSYNGEPMLMMNGLPRINGLSVRLVNNDGNTDKNAKKK
ncbi:MAG: hypothetical protein J5642_01840 [Bacteroidales bacterium]|nr:hypothetical protein [Bacteroidales bacterium]